MITIDDILALAAKQLPEAGVKVMLIGGFAVNYYGYTRNTLDIDFMMAADRLSIVKSIMKKAGLDNVSIEENVAFFSPPDASIRVDFIRVDEETLRKLYANSIVADIHGFPLHLPGLKDLLAMKIFALTQMPARRMGKDLPDIAFLSVMNGLNMESDIKPLCDQFGQPAIFDMIKKSVKELEAS